MPAPGYRNTSLTEAASDDLSHLQTIVGAALGRPVSKSDAVRLARRLVYTHQDRIRPVALDMDLITWREAHSR